MNMGSMGCKLWRQCMAYLRAVLCLMMGIEPEVQGCCCRYWLMCAGDELYASKTGLVGSIGVISAGVPASALL